MTDQMAMDLAHVESRPDAAAWRSAWRAKERWYSRWERGIESELAGADALIARNLDSALGGVEKSRAGEILGQVAQRLTAGIREGLAARRSGAEAAYVGLALDTGEDAGQFALDALGLNRTFAWAGQRDFVRDALAVRGSKIIQHLYGSHLERLAQLVVGATAPEAPKTVDELRREVLAEWPLLRRGEAQRIARTEAGIVWERTNWYALRANGVQRVKWLVAHGPAIGVRVSPVCPRCLAMAAGSPYKMGELDEIPPLHPNCRCTLVPVLDARWLPPAQPWTGSEAPLPTAGLDSPGGRIVPRQVQVFKSGRVWGHMPARAHQSGWGVMT